MKPEQAEMQTATKYGLTERPGKPPPSLLDEIADLEKRRLARIETLLNDRVARKREHAEALEAIDAELALLDRGKPRKPRAAKKKATE